MTTLRRNKYLIVAIAVALLYLLAIQLPRLLDPFAIEKDFRNFYLVFRVQDPSLFPGHDLGTLERASPLFTFILWSASRFMAPALVHKLLAFPLLLISVYFMYRIGEHIGSSRTGLVLAIGFVTFNLACNTEVAVTGGIQRSFAVPILITLVWMLMQRKLWAVVTTLALSFLIYLPIMPVTGLTVLFSLILRREGGRWQFAPDWRKLVPLGLSGVLVSFILFPELAGLIHEHLPTNLNAFQEGRHMLMDPVYRRGGRYPLFVWFPITGRAGFVSGAHTFIQLGLLGILAVVIRFVRGDDRRRLPDEVMFLLFGSLSAFILSWLAIILTSSTLLYLPSRHTESSFFVVLVLFVFINLRDTLRDLAVLISRKRHRLVTIVIPVMVLIFSASALAVVFSGGNSDRSEWQILRLLLLTLTILTIPILWLYWKESDTAHVTVPERSYRSKFILLAGVMIFLAPIYIYATAPPFYRPSDSDLALYNFLATLPADFTIAGDPCSLDDVQYYAQRNALYSCWNATANTKSLVDGIDGYYAESVTPILEFCDRYGVDVLVVNEATLSREYLEHANIIYEPQASILAPRLHDRTNFVLANVPDEQRLFQSATKFVVSCTAQSITSTESHPASD